jgi:hypothetical protein
MTIHLNKDRTHTTATMTTTSATVSGHTTRTENVGHTLNVENVFSSPDLFDILLTKARNCFGSVKPNIKQEFLGILESK